MADESQRQASAAGIVLVTLAAGQFLMTLDTSVMNVSIATVAKDVHTTVTGIQTAITVYTLVMASLMITGGKIGQIFGRKRAFAVGCVIYGCGSFITAISPNLAVLMVGWSFLEGVGAALILPAIVALVASNFARAERPRAYGLVASAGAIAVAAGPLIGGLFTTYLSWRLVFAGEVLLVLAILTLTRRIADVRPERRAPLDLIGTALSALGLALIVLGILRAGVWGFVQPKPGAPEWVGLSPTIWLVLGGGVVLLLFIVWEGHRIARSAEPLLDPAILKNPTLRGGLISFFFQYLLQAGLFFAVPLFLSVALGLSAIETGVRLLPLSVTLLLAAAGIPKVFPTRHHVASCSSASSRCSPESSSWSPRSTPAPGLRSSHGRCCSRASALERLPPSWAASPFRRCPIVKVVRSEGCRTRSRTWAHRSAPHWPEPCSSQHSRHR